MLKAGCFLLVEHSEANMQSILTIGFHLPQYGRLKIVDSRGGLHDYVANHATPAIGLQAFAAFLEKLRNVCCMSKGFVMLAICLTACGAPQTSVYT